MGADWSATSREIACSGGASLTMMYAVPLQAMAGSGGEQRHLFMEASETAGDAATTAAALTKIPWQSTVHRDRAR